MVALAISACTPAPHQVADSEVLMSLECGLAAEELVVSGASRWCK